MSCPDQTFPLARVPLTWEEVPCPLCRARKEELVLDVPQQDGTSFRLVRCEMCELVYVNPRPDEASIARFYPEDYRPYQTPSTRSDGWRDRLQRLLLTLHHGHPGDRGRWWDRLAVTLLYPWLRPNRNSLTSLPYQGQGKLLDFGCGSGWFAHRMGRLGWEVECIDFSEHSARQAREAYGLTVHVGSLPHPAIAADSLDVINMGSVLEHVHQPHRLIDAAARALRPGGYLAVSVPNFESWTMRHFLPHCFHLDVPRHLLHFTPATLRRLLTAHGLEVRQVRMLPRTSWMKRTLDSAIRDASEPRQRRLARWANLPGVRNLLSRWTGWARRADLFLALAYRPLRAARIRVSA